MPRFSNPFCAFCGEKNLNDFCKAAAATRCGTHRPIRIKVLSRDAHKIILKSAVFSHFSKVLYANLVIFQRNTRHSYKIPYRCAATYYGSSLNVPELFPTTFNEFLQFFQTADLRFGKNVFGKRKINTPGLFLRGCHNLLRHGSLNCDSAIARYHSSIMSSYFFAICSFDSFCPSGSSFCCT